MKKYRKTILKCFISFFVTALLVAGVCETSYGFYIGTPMTTGVIFGVLAIVLTAVNEHEKNNYDLFD